MRLLALLVGSALLITLITPVYGAPKGSCKSGTCPVKRGDRPASKSGKQAPKAPQATRGANR